MMAAVYPSSGANHPFLHFRPFGSARRMETGDVIDAVLNSARVSESAEKWLVSLRQHDSLCLLDCKVVALEHRKNKRGAQHEYLLFTLLCKGPSSGRMYTRYLRTDRSFLHNPEGVLRHYRNLLRGGGMLADDTVLIELEAFREGSYSLYEMTFDEARAPNILELAVLLQVVTFLARRYRLYTFMCYWHARIVYDALYEIFHGRQEEGEKPRSRGKFKCVGITLPIVSEGGHFLMTKISILRRESYYREMPTLSRIVDRFRVLRREIEAGRGEAAAAAHRSEGSDSTRLTHVAPPCISDRSVETLQPDEENGGEMYAKAFVELYFFWIISTLVCYNILVTIYFASRG